MARRKKVTLKNIADMLDVTPATVSKALRNSTDISEEMRVKVKKLAKKVGYRPNLLAQTLINRRSYLLGVIIPDLRISFFSEVTRGIYEQARARGYVAILMVNDEKTEIERKNLEFLSDLHVDGILLNPVPGIDNYDFYAQLVDEGIPIVCYDRQLTKFDFNSVTIDDRKAAFKLTSRLIEEGRRKILFLGPQSGFSVAEQRYRGYVDALKTYGIPLDPDFIVYCELYADESYRVLKNVIARGLKPDAVLCVGGLGAYGAGQAILESQLSIPDEVSLAEFGDNRIISRLGVPFWTISQNPYEMGQAAVDLLVRNIEGEPSETTEHIIIETQLIRRTSGPQGDVQ